MTDIHDLTLNSDVLVWREGNTGQSNNWEGLYKLVAMNGESCVLALPHGNTTFHLTSVKPFNVLDNQTEVEYPEPERNGQEIEDEDIIVVNTLLAIP
jgi:hypothetical protein